MTMICRITDETINNPWDEVTLEHEQEQEEAQTIHDITIADIMGEDFTVWVGRNKEFGFVMEIEDENNLTSTEKCIHPYAMESMASFCRQFLNHYDKINKDE